MALESWPMSAAQRTGLCAALLLCVWPWPGLGTVLDARFVDRLAAAGWVRSQGWFCPGLNFSVDVLLYCLIGRLGC